MDAGKAYKILLDNLTKEQRDKFKEWKVEHLRKQTKPTYHEQSGQFRIMYRYFQGPEVIRKTREEFFHLQLKWNNKWLSLVARNDPFRGLPIAFSKENVTSKWFDFTGTLPPSSDYNPTKTLDVHVEELDKGDMNIEDIGDVADRFVLDLSGEKLDGTYLLEQDSVESDFYTLSEYETENLKKKFVVQYHSSEEHPEFNHYDLRLEQAEGLKNYHLEDNPLELKEGETTSSDRPHYCETKKWLKEEGEIEPNSEGNPYDAPVQIKIIDEGTYNQISDERRFQRWNFQNSLKGIYYWKVEDSRIMFGKARGVSNIAGDPEDKPYSPLEYIDVDEDTFRLELYDAKWFSSGVSADEVNRYDLPEKAGVSYNLGKLSREGELDDVKIISIEFDKDKFTGDKARNWTKENDLTDWTEKFKKG